MAILNSVCCTQKLPPASTRLTTFVQSPKFHISLIVPSTQLFSKSFSSKNCSLSRRKRNWVIGSVTEEREVVPVKDNRSKDIESRLSLNGLDEFEPLSPSSSVSEGDDFDRLKSRTINAIIVLGFGTFAVTKLLTIDHDYWHGWTLYEILRYVPEHNWVAYEQALKANPVLAKMAISGVVYSLGDWIAQCVEGKPLFEFDRTRLFRSGLVGFTLHGSLSHYYYQFCEALFPFQEWWVVLAKVAFDQTIWAAIWNSIYFVVLGFLRLESRPNIFNELKLTFWPMLTAGWKLWPFAHLITYGVIPVEQRLLWVDCVELIWVTILSTYSNEKSEARISGESSEENPSSSSSQLED
ncbi:Peroxisomal membrane (Mpv17/PMP22) family protein [Quillaja saponaria]|uniref:Peroxisomal membrane (Mpv17/PMP22) family protein n=1 Tax=Quillaja saponaria TaxID=32244 RepID=A0AAD7QIH9_QUISA|nr:Peroxisomal membrane (Mpv17/PMP22) family protein [Quillaja saponaria]